MTPNTKIFTDLLRESRAFLTVSAAEYDLLAGIAGKDIR